MNKRISIRDLQKISAKTIVNLDGPTPIKVGDQTIGALFPLKKTDPKKLRAVLLQAEQLAKRRDTNADDAALEKFGPVDMSDWSLATAASAASTKSRTNRKK